MNCFLSRNYKGLNNAGNKAKTDIENTMEKMGSKNIGLKRTYSEHSITHFFLNLIGVLKAIFSIQKGDILVLQYPLKKYFSFVCRMAHLRGAKVIVLIHDLGSFRRKKLTIKQEMKRLGFSDHIITHNNRMKEWLEQNGCKPQLSTLEIFDYLSTTKAKSTSNLQKPFSVLYAGGLAKRKNTFLYEIGEHMSSYTLNLYGKGFEIEEAKGAERIQYKGFVQSDTLIATAEGDFGLVWDGFTLEGCTGDFGEYLQYNNPHKTSLYIRCELPIIIWNKAALASFIKQNNIGICVDSLTELNEILAKLSMEEYQQMKANVKKISAQLADGHYARTAILRAIQQLS